MKKILFIVFLTFGMSVSVFAEPFLSIYEKAQNQTLEIEETHLFDAEEYVWVFVAGILNEFVGWTNQYFGDNIRRLITYVPEEQVEIIRPSSGGSIKANARELSEKFKAIHIKHQKKLMIITHSKGSPETLLMMANQPKKSAEMIHSVLTIQAAFGSRVADLFEDGELVEQDGYIRLPWDERATLKLAYWSTLFLKFWMADGFKTLTIESMSNIFNEEVVRKLKQHPSSICFLKTAQDPEHMAYSVYSTGKYLSHFGPSDGMVNIENQKLKGVGVDLGVINADHVDTILNGRPLSNAPTKFRQHLTDAIFYYLISQ